MNNTFVFQSKELKGEKNDSCDSSLSLPPFERGCSILNPLSTKINSTACTSLSSN